jgi:hypothetical protein
VTPHEIAFRGILYGGAITLLGTFVANVFQVFLQWRQHKWGISAEKKKIFAEKRLGALQGVVQLCDFIGVNWHRGLDPIRKRDWERIRRENLSNGGLLPHDVQQAFQTVVLSIKEEHVLEQERVYVDSAAMGKLRELCLEAIHREFESD